jgi:hypothetical protein
LCRRRWSQIFRLADTEKVRIAALHRFTVGVDRFVVARMPALLVLARHADDCVLNMLMMV